MKTRPRKARSGGPFLLSTDMVLPKQLVLHRQLAGFHLQAPEVVITPSGNDVAHQIRPLTMATAVPTNADHDGGVGRPWLIVDDNDANGGNFRPCVRCGDCRTDRD